MVVVMQILWSWLWMWQVMWEMKEADAGSRDIGVG